MSNINFIQFWSTLNLINAITGSGVLGLAFAAAKLGPLLLTLLIIITAVITIGTLYITIKAHSRYENVPTFDILISQACGRWYGYGAVCTVIAQSMGSAASYLYILWQEIFQLVNSNILAYVILAIAIIFIWILCCLPIMRLLGPASLISLCCMFYYLFAVVIYWTGSWHPQSILIRTSYDSWEAVPILFFALTGHMGAVQSCEELTNDIRRAITCFTAVSVTLFIYIVTSWAGYLTFGANVSTNLLFSYPKESPVFITIARWAAICAVSLTVPASLLPFKTCLSNRLGLKSNNWYNVLLGTISLALSISLAVFAGKLSNIFSIVGGIVSPMLMFVWPALLFYFALAKNKLQKGFAMLGLTLGFGMCAFFSCAMIITSL